jgi:hypothetical protein
VRKDIVGEITAAGELGVTTLPARLSALGSAVIALGADDNGAAALALWQVSPEGAPTGAWIVPQAEAFGNEQVARRLLICVDGRAVTGADMDTVCSALGKLAKSAQLEISNEWWSVRSYSSVDVFGELVARRAAYERMVEARRQTTKNISPLEWPRDFTLDQLPTDFAGLQILSPLGIAPGAAAVSEVLTVSRVLRWLVELWSQTEQTRNRRPYLREVPGDPEPLPPSWLAAMRAALSARLPL